MSQKPLGFGIWGTGMIAEFHAKALAEIPGVKVVAAYNRTAAKAEAFARQYGATACATPEALLAHPEVDVVCLCTPSGDHLAPALACARAGKHVVVEKPLEVTLARCDALTAACAQAGVVLAGILPRRFGAGSLALKSAIVAGRFGQVTLAGALIPWWRTQAYYDSAAWRGTFSLDGGGALMTSPCTPSMRSSTSPAPRKRSPPSLLAKPTSALRWRTAWSPPSSSRTARSA